MIQSTHQFCRRSAGRDSRRGGPVPVGGGLRRRGRLAGDGLLLPLPPAQGGRSQAGAGARRALCPGLRRGAASPELLQSAAIPVPLVVGLLRPRILLPERELSPEQWEGVLTHELVHWRRHDLWIKWLAVLARAVHWFNPAVWWLVCRLEQDCELSCDEQTVRRWDSPAGRGTESCC